MKSVPKLVLALILGISAAAPSAFASEAHPMADATPATPTQDAAASMSEGEIKKVDKDAGKVIIKHGELKNLGMPPMTMVFRAKDPAMLEKVKQGDKVSFVAEKVGGQYTVTQIEVRQ